MDLSNPVLSGLIRKRQEVADDIEQAQTRLRQLILDIDALDGAICLFSPTIDRKRRDGTTLVFAGRGNRLLTIVPR